MISSINSHLDDVEEELKKSKEEASELQDKVSELENDLAEVKHFENDGSVRQGFSRIKGAINYTGDVTETQIDGTFNGWDGDTILK